MEKGGIALGDSPSVTSTSTPANQTISATSYQRQAKPLRTSAPSAHHNPWSFVRGGVKSAMSTCLCGRLCVHLMHGILSSGAFRRLCMRGLWIEHRRA